MIMVHIFSAVRIKWDKFAKHVIYIIKMFLFILLVFLKNFYFSITVDIQYYMSFRCTTQ